MTRAEVDQQNKEYVQYLKDARTDIHQLISTGMTTLFAQREDAPTADNLVVFNPLSWARDGVVTIDAPPGQAVSVRDLQTNTEQPTQRISPTKVAFLAKEVPSVGYRTYTLETEAAAARTTPPHSATSAVRLENRFYRVQISPRDGAVISVFDKQLRTELLNQKFPDKIPACRSRF